MNRNLKSLHPAFLALVGFLILGSARGQSALDGFRILGERNCVACHTASPVARAWIQPKTAPRLAELPHRADPAWVQAFLADPHQSHPGTSMPDVLATLRAGERAAAAEALTHHLFASDEREFQRVLPDRAAVARGDTLFHQVGCVACHAPQAGTHTVHESAPFPDLPAKWSHDGLRRFLRDPLAVRPSGRMPSLNLSDGEAADIAHFLLRETRVPAPLEFTQFRGRIEALEDLDSAEWARTGSATNFGLGEFGRDRRQAIRYSGWIEIRTNGLHTFHLDADGASRIAVDERWLLGADSWQTEKVSGKSSLRLDPGWHPITVDYVHRGRKEPRLQVQWEEPGGIREAIPAARLSREAGRMATAPLFTSDPDLAAKGREFYGQLHCGACHDPNPTVPHAPALASLDPARGCLAEVLPVNVPHHSLSTAERSAVREALARLSTPTLPSPTADERVARTLATFRCVACHQREGVGGPSADRDPFFTSAGEDLGDEGRIPPDLNGVGDRLQPDWLSRVLGEGAPIRPYLHTRMPQFGPANVAHLAPLLVELDRRAEPIPNPPDTADALREAGRQLVGTDGLSCIACHRFNRQPAHQMQVVDLGTVSQRLNPDWFRRFLQDPNRYHPGTRMPAFWPEGISALPAVLDGDMNRQHAALWTYLADGPNAKFPEGLSRQNVELIVGGEAVVYRGKLWEAGFRGVATGYPGQLNAAFDAEEIRLSLLWRGRFLNAGAHWGVQGMGRIRPLGTDVIVLPHGPELAVLTSPDDAWPTNTVPGPGPRFRGYQLDAKRQPILLHGLGALTVEDLLEPLPAGGPAGFRRTLKFTGTLPEGLHFRMGMGPISPIGPIDRTWSLSDAMEVRLPNPPATPPLLRGEGSRRELLLPVRTHTLEVDYVWTKR